MTLSFLITFRETLEASLVIGIVLAYLRNTHNAQHERYAWMGVGSGIILSIAFAALFQAVFGGLTGEAEEIYESVTMLIAAALITWMVLWMLGQSRRLRSNLERKVETHMSDDHPIGIFLLTLLSVGREGTEMVIFLQAALLQTRSAHASLGAGLGMVLSIAMSYAVFRGMRRLPLGAFLRVSSVLLILFAAGLVAHGVRALASDFPPSLLATAWNINPLLPEDGPMGSVLAGVFGYNSDPSIIEVLTYIGYLASVSCVWLCSANRGRRVG